MFWKLLVVTVCVVVMGTALLGLRTHRQHLHHEITQLHVQIDQARHRTWDAQVRIAERAAPGALRAAVERAGMELEPSVPRELRHAVPGDGRDDGRMVEARHPGRAGYRP